MELIVILVCLGLERYGHVGSRMGAWRWFDQYVSWLKSTVGKSMKLTGWLGAIVIAAPVLILAYVLYGWLHTKMFGLVGFIFSIFILLYCLGTPAVPGEPKAHLPEEKKAEGAAVPAVLWESNETLFALLFWFVLLGPVGALFYRMLNWIHHKAHADKSLHTLMAPVKKVEGILDWIPARLVAFGYALMGNFSATVRYWKDHVLSGPHNNRQLLLHCGAHALEIERSAGEGAEAQAQLLVNRTLLLFIVIIAIFTLIAWL